jgi:hypothetical protein
LDDCIFGEIMKMKSTHNIWLNEKYGVISNDDNDDEPKEIAHEDVERDHVSHPIFRRKPNASHMCARIKFTHI